MLFLGNRKSIEEAVGCQSRQTAVAKWGVDGAKGLASPWVTDVGKNWEPEGVIEFLLPPYLYHHQVSCCVRQNLLDVDLNLSQY